MEGSPGKPTGRFSPEKRAPDGAGTIRVTQPVDTTFDYLADGTHDSAWQSEVSTSELLRYGGGVGAVYRQSLHDTVLGGSEFQYRVIHHRRPVLLVVEAISLTGHPQASYRLEPLGPALTRITLVMELAGRDAQSLLAADAVRWHDRLVSSLPHLKARLDELPV
ncbi:MAG TPA: SRPBCC family protein [Candidatus Dormibacteraeota bacterium]|nr:SRPBCC family protein [Candidatus Dormibacteraeota bacterium]